MKKFIVIFLTLTALTANAESIRAHVNERIPIALDIPIGKIGGGDFYNVSVEPYGADYGFVMTPDGIDISFSKAGVSDLRISVNHVVKSTCASVHIEPVSVKDIRFEIE
ncbi:MAG: hypothetical protein AB7E76_07915 [Deferribacterales bacterium]